MPFKIEILFDVNQSAIALGQLIKKKLMKYKIVYLKDVLLKPNKLRCFYEAVANQIGELVPIDEDSVTGAATQKTWVSIYYDASMPDRYRHSKTGQPLHTDTAYIANGGDVSLLYCVNQAPSGGETIFYDSEDLLKKIKEHDLCLYKDLCNVEVLFSKTSDQKLRQIITFNKDKPILTWNYHRVDPNQAPNVIALAERFHQFLETQVLPLKNIFGVALKPREAVFWRDEELLHGRRAYEAKELNDRLLWKVHIKMKKAMANT